MTEKIVNSGKPPFYMGPFAIAFLLAPLLGTLPTMIIPLIAVYALIFGFPLYVLVGLPILLLHLQNEPPHYLPIVLRGALAQLILFPMGIAIHFIAPEAQVMAVLPVFLLPAVIFGMLWAASFTLIYRRLIRDL